MTSVNINPDPKDDPPQPLVFMLSPDPDPSWYEVPIRIFSPLLSKFHLNLQQQECCGDLLWLGCFRDLQNKYSSESVFLPFAFKLRNGTRMTVNYNSDNNFINLVRACSFDVFGAWKYHFRTLGVKMRLPMSRLCCFFSANLFGSRVRMSFGPPYRPRFWKKY